jgi:hypothetical protein
MRGRAGCASSIRQIVKQAKEKKLENVLILEDDVTFVEGTNKVLETSLKDLSNFDWRMFYLGASVRDEFSETPLVKVTDNLLRMVGGQCTHAFACHNSIYDEVLDGIGDIDRIIPWLYANEAIDKWIAKNIQTNHDVYCTNPIIATQRPCWSDIDSKQADFGQELIDRFNSFLK